MTMQKTTLTYIVAVTMIIAASVTYAADTTPTVAPATSSATATATVTMPTTPSQKEAMQAPDQQTKSNSIQEDNKTASETPAATTETNRASHIPANATSTTTTPPTNPMPTAPTTTPIITPPTPTPTITTPTPIITTPTPTITTTTPIITTPTTTPTITTTTTPTTSSPPAQQPTPAAGTNTVTPTTTPQPQQAATPMSATEQTPAQQASTPTTMDSKVIQFSENAAVTTFSYDYKNYQDSLDKMEPFFTKNGWISFNKALKQSNNLQVIQKEKLSVSAKLSGKSQVTHHNNGSDKELWQVQVPIQVTYKNEKNDQIQQDLVIRLSITKVDTTKNSNGMGIDQFVATIAAKKS